MYKRKQRIVTCAILAAVVVFTLMMISFINNMMNTEINIFADMSELSVLEDSIVGDITDEYADDILVNNAFLHEINYESKIFKLYAYEFVTVDGANKYYSVVTGSTSPELSHWNRSGGFGFSSGEFGNINEIIVKNENLVYRVRYIGSGRKFSKVIEYLNSIFSVQIRG